MENAEQELSFKKFFDVYKQKIVPELEKLEPYRIKLLEKYKKDKIFYLSLFIFSITLILFSFSLPVFLHKTDFDPLISTFAQLAPMFLGIPLAMYSGNFLTNNNYKNIKNYKNMLKYNVMDDILKTFGNIEWIKHDKTKTWEDREYSDLNNKSQQEILEFIDKIEKGQYRLDRFDRSGLFLDYNEKYLDDEFKCVYKGVPFNIYEIMLFKNLGKNSYTAFNGIVINYKYNKKIKNRTVVATKGNTTKKQNFMYSLIFSAFASLEIFKHGYSHGKLIFAIILFLISAYFEWKFKKYEEPLNIITLEDPKFNKKFDVYSSDEVEARYLVTPLFMELLNNLKTVFNSKEIKCSFFDDNFMLAISTNEDIFEIGDINVPCTDMKFILQFWKELSSIYKMVEYFRLNKELYPQKT